MPLVVVPVDLVGPLPTPELQQHRREVVRQLPVVHLRGTQRVANHHIEEQRGTRDKDGPNGEECFRQIGRFEKAVRPFLSESPFQQRSTRCGASAQQQKNQLQVVGLQLTTSVGENHDRLSRS
jgi:hypothetical protein